MEKKKHITLLTLNILAFLGTVGWVIADPSFEPVIGIFLTGAGLVGFISPKKEQFKQQNEIQVTKQIIKENVEQETIADHLEKNINDDIVERFPESTVFFYDRFCAAFPGVRGIQWYDNTEEILLRLSRLLVKPLTLKKEDGTSSFNPIWWWRDGNLQIRDFEITGPNTILLNWEEIKIEKIAAVNPGSYYQCFVYIHAAPMEPTGLYPRTSEEVEWSVNNFGYCREEYGIYKNNYKITRDEYDDGAAMIDGKLVDFNGNAKLRVRYITPYNIVVAPVNSPINNNRFDSNLKKIMNGILQGGESIESLMQAVEKLPKKEPRG